MSPLAARIAEVEGINTDGIVGTGPKGKIMKADVLSVLNGVQVKLLQVLKLLHQQALNLLKHLMKINGVLLKLYQCHQCVKLFLNV